MKKRLIAVLAAASLLFAAGAYAEDQAALPGAQTEAPEAIAETAPAAETELELTEEYRWFVNEYRNVRGYTVTYYDDVYAYNHGEYYLTPFSSVVPAEYFVVDADGTYAVAPIVLDITDAMRTRLYGADVGETYLLYGQYCERVVGKKGREGFSGVHEGIDFVNEEACSLYAILGGEVTRAGDSNGTVGVYNAELDITLLYLHCEDIVVRRGDVIEAGDLIAKEGDKKSGSYYTHVEMRHGRHTSSSPYRGPKLTSDCPYAVMQEALGVVESGRQPVTAAAVYEAQRMRQEAEAALRAMEEEAARAAAEAEKAAEPEIELVDTLPGAEEGYGFEPETNAQPAPEATLPPA
ncbi:MAG: peptidoglycan DD-metalloendopeptidase family protein [Clostridia bacterium]|nr:peptidoglycan DD-metalloendopeptidase family protein [Clostridia bacterium]